MIKKKKIMAASITSSALSCSLPHIERFTNFIVTNNIQRSILQRRKARVIFLSTKQVYSTLYCGVTKPGRCSTGLGIYQQPFSRLVRTLSQEYVGSWKCGQVQSMADKVKPFEKTFYTPSHWLCRLHSTTRYSQKSVDTSEQSVTSWKSVEKESQIREASKEFLDDLKETKARVKEKMDEIIERENIWTVPNLLCVSRICFSPILSYLVISTNYHWALGLFMFAGFTDLLDGWIARTFPNQASNLGSFLDPLADKVLVAILFLSLTYVELIPLPLTGLIIYRDVLIIGGASFVRYKSLPPPRTLVRYFDASHATAKLAPTTLSKVNTAVQLSLITAALAAPVFTCTDHYLLKALWWITAATTLSSGISYIFSRDTYKFLKSMENQKQ